MKFKEIGSSLENRARESGRDIDNQWIHENETDEGLYNHYLKSSDEAISRESSSLEKINSIARRKNAQESDAVKDARKALDDLKKLIDNIDSNKSMKR